MSAQGQPSRYTRSFNGMTGALIVTVLAVLAFVAWRGLWRSDVDDASRKPWTGRRASSSRSRQTSRSSTPASCRPGGRPPAPSSPPATTRGGASACSPTTVASSGSGSRTRRSTDLVELYVDEDAEAGDDATVTSDITDTWQTWSDDGGDVGYSTELGDEALLVYGSAPAEDIETYLGLLTR